MTDTGGEMDAGYNGGVADVSETASLMANVDADDTPMEKTPDASSEHTGGQYGSFVAYCFSVNYILGVGVLSVPYAFYSGGIVAGPAMLLLVSVFALFAFVWIIETLARAEVYVDDADGEQNVVDEVEGAINDDCDDKDGYGGARMDKDTEESAIVVDDTKDQDMMKKEKVDGYNTISKTPNFRITHRKFEMNEVTKLFLGAKVKILYDIFVALYLYGALWSYSAVFAESMASHVPFPVLSIANGFHWVTCNVYTDSSLDCTFTYAGYLFVFGLIVVPLTCLNLTEQKALQVLMALFRFFALGLMIVTITYAILFDPYSRYPSKPDTPIESHGPYLSPNHVVSPFGFYKLLPVAIYSQIVHHSVPGLSQPVKNKKHLTKIFSAVFLSTLTLYTGLGVSLSAYYGPNMAPTATLNFGFFRGGVPWDQSVPMWAEVVNYIVVLFPAIDVLSAFPLNAITLGNNIFAAFFTGTKWMKKRPVEVAFRLLAALPPLVGALFVRNLATILQYVGLIGFVITFIFPPVLNLVSRYYCEKRFRTSKTPYTLPFISSTACCVFVLFFAVFSVSYCIMTNILVGFGRLPA